jgi:hypothetical protein
MAEATAGIEPASIGFCEVTLVFTTGGTLFRCRDHVLRFRLIAETYSRKSQFLPGRLGRDDQCDLFHLVPSRKSAVHVVGAISNFELNLPHWAEHAEDHLLAFAEPSLGMRPKAGPAERLVISWASDRDKFAFVHIASNRPRPELMLDGRDARRSQSLKTGEQPPAFQAK